MATVVEEFAPTAIKNASVQFRESDGTQLPGTKFGCLGNMEGETTLKELIKKCEGVEVKKKIKPEKMDLTISGHIPVAVVRNFFGLNTDNLKPGVYQYSTQSKGKDFVFTADVIDEFEEVVKLIAFPNATSSIGFKFAVENGTDEVAEMEVEVTAYPDEHKNIMYEAFVAELDDPTIADTWHTQFNYALVEAIPTP